MPFLRIAVPVFFIVSGYFLWSSDRNAAIGHCKKALKKVAWLTLFANIIYCIFWLIINTGDSKFPIHDIKSGISFLLFGGSFGFHLWYLTAYIETLIVFIIALQLKKEKFLFYLIPICLLINLLTGKYAIIPSVNGNIIRNFFTTGIPCFCIGWWIRGNEVVILQKVAKRSSVLLFVTLLFSYLEWGILRYLKNENPGDIYFFSIPLAVSAIFFCLENKKFGRSSFLEKIGKKYTTDIYIYHLIIGYCFLSVCSRMNIPTLQIIAAPFVYVLTLLFTIILKYIQENRFWIFTKEFLYKKRPV